MSPRLTIFRATLVQDSALSVAGVDREGSSDQPFSMVDNEPVLAGRGLKGAAVSMARRFFDPLPRSISEERSRNTGLRRSAWEFSHARPVERPKTALRAGVGILQKTGARARGVLYDREVIPAGTRWALCFRVDWRLAGGEAEEAEGILGCILRHHWMEGRCWLGGGVARGLGWCHIEDLQAIRLDEKAHDQWLRDAKLPQPEGSIPTVQPTRNWCFRTLDVTLRFGEYRPDPNQDAWGVDMLAVGPHDMDRGVLGTGTGDWASPAWVTASTPRPDALETDRAVLMEAGAPLLPGSSIRGPLRHAFSRRANAAGVLVQDPHLAQGGVGAEDAAGKIFGTVSRSSRVLIRDARADEGWSAARLHMHAEDEFSGGSYGKAKRDAVRVLSGAFPVTIVVEGEDDAAVRPLVEEINRLVALGALGHLPVGGHKTRGAGWGRWDAGKWAHVDVAAQRTWEPAAEIAIPGSPDGAAKAPGTALYPKLPADGAQPWADIEVATGTLPGCEQLSLGQAVQYAEQALGQPPAAWWCEPGIDFGVKAAPVTFGLTPPHGGALRIDEVLFFTPTASWRAARCRGGWRTVLIREVQPGTPNARRVEVVRTPARLHQDGTRFAVAYAEAAGVVIREWQVDGQVLGFTLVTDAGGAGC